MAMKVVMVGFGALGFGWVAADPLPGTGGKDLAKARTAEPAAAAKAGMRPGSKSGMGMGMGMGKMMGKGMDGGMWPTMVASDAKLEVKNLSKGVSLTFTSESADTVSRRKKAAEGMRLMHEAHAR
jgi:hypothetical protein